MKKKSLMIFITLLFTLAACSSESVESDSPDYIKDSFEYFKSIKSLVDSINDGEDTDKAIKSNFENQREFNDWIEINYDPEDESSEEALLISHYLLIKELLGNLSIFKAAESMGVEDGNSSSTINSIEDSLSNLESIYENYGYEPKD
ncbi:hypothetical protein [Bacillus safensis]|uniref:hypothetical protein n=1 Tax=Bacillus safensis TaxID=561879 RepID=UPI0020CD2F6D|nr:hypothetical protein [Bacillus safensis]MCP9283579.1 hypothetical protein [Bacillus safensis]